MTLLVMLASLVVWFWLVGRLLDASAPAEAPSPAEGPGDAQLPTTPRRAPLLISLRRAVPSVRQDCPPWPLTEDELIEFGRELESSDDVVAELVASQ
jgi:hypothetical protein